MKCHYDVLEVELNASEEEIRKSYKKLALKWHPDKNLDNSEEAKSQFQLIQQAYEVLSDPQERSWYDRHRDSILKGGLGSDYQDDSLNVYQYFNTNCFKGYGDDEKGFYAVYSEVFNTIAAEDSEFCDDDEIPVFGNSTSSYEDVVRSFYNYWQSYSTKKSYSWLDKYDIREAPNRKVLRLMEKENKKIRDKARKERNEEVRALVSFVRKRDKRVKEYIVLLEKKAVENDKKLQDLRRKQIIKRQEEMSSYVESDWAKFSNLEGELKEIEANVANEFADSGTESEVSDSEDENVSVPHCLACNKVFKTEKALVNHEKSKKHKENLELLEAVMKMEDEQMKNNSENSESPVVEEQFQNGENEIVEDQITDEEPERLPRRGKKKKKNRNRRTAAFEEDLSEGDDADVTKLPPLSDDDDDKTWKSNKVISNRRQNKNSKPIQNSVNGISEENNVNEMIPESSKMNGKVAANQCVVCSEMFSSKNELFKHLKTTGHAVPLTENPPSSKSRRKKK